MSTLLEALAQPEQEHVAIVCNKGPKFQHIARLTEQGKSLPDGAKLYTTPPQRKPLTDEQERAAFEEWAKSLGLIAVSHGIRSQSSQLELAWSAWKAKAAYGIKGDA